MADSKVDVMLHMGDVINKLQAENASLRQQLTKPADDTISVSKGEWEAMNIQAAIGKLVLEKFVSGNSVPVSRCYINASELEAIAKDSHENN